MSQARRVFVAVLGLAGLAACAGLIVWVNLQVGKLDSGAASSLRYQPRQPSEISGFGLLLAVTPAAGETSLRDIARAFDRLGLRRLELLDRQVAERPPEGRDQVIVQILRAESLGFEGRSRDAYRELCLARSLAEQSPPLAEEFLYTLIFLQGVAALRIGEDENCILCRGESSCIIPIARSAVHTNPEGSRLAIRHFTEYLERFPDDLGVRWLLMLAHMTLGEYPEAVERRFALPLDRFLTPEFDIGRFRDVGHRVGVNRFNQAGGAIMDDFDRDGLLDIVVTSWDAGASMAWFRNRGDGTFEDRTEAAGLADQLGGLYCVQTDFNNDGWLDIFICRGAWLAYPMRPSLLKNNGDGTFTDVTKAAGLDQPVNSISGAWGDFDNDGWLDLFLCCERQPSKLYRNRGDGTFVDVADSAGVAGRPGLIRKGAAWVDFNNDGRPDLFVNNYTGPPELFRNNGDGTFTDVARALGIEGPTVGFACWAFDFDNDGFEDVFATSYDRSLEAIAQTLAGLPHALETSRLYRNAAGRRFEDVTRSAGLDGCFVTMGCNFADFDNDGWLDFYLGTGDPNFSTLTPNRMFRNVAGRRFADITASAGVGNLQKGHGVACGDWDRDGNIDLFIEMGGAVNGDRYHNILFQNPGQRRHWLTVKLIGKRTNRPAIGARLRVVTGPPTLTIHRTVTSGSSFGANPLEQTIGLGDADRIERLEVIWPTSGTTQVFRNVPVDQIIEIEEFADSYRRIPHRRIPLPPDDGK